MKEVVRRVKMSERSVRKHLLILIRRGLLRRRAIQNGSRRVSYEYSLRPAKELISAARDDLTSTLNRLERAVRRLGGAKEKKASPKSASSWRN